MEREPPDYVPPMWTNGRLNRWFAASPRRVVAWFVVFPLVAVTLAAVFFVEGSIWRGAGVSVAAVLLLKQAVVYVPRAWRAARRSTP